MDELFELVIELVFELVRFGVEESKHSKKKKHKSTSNNYKYNKSINRIFKDDTTYQTIKPPKQNTTPIFNEPSQQSFIERPNKEVRNSKSVIDEALHITHKTEAVKLEIMLIGFMIYEDDGRIDFNERKILKTHLSKHADILDDNDLMDIRRQDNMIISIESIRSYISNNNITGISVSKAIGLLKEINRETMKYHDVISRLESGLIDLMGF